MKTISPPQVDLGRWTPAQIDAANTAAATVRRGKNPDHRPTPLEACDPVTIREERERALEWRERYACAMETGRLYSAISNNLLGEWHHSSEMQSNFKHLVAFADAFVRRCDAILAEKGAVMA